MNKLETSAVLSTAVVGAGLAAKVLWDGFKPETRKGVVREAKFALEDTVGGTIELGRLMHYAATLSLDSLFGTGLRKGTHIYQELREEREREQSNERIRRHWSYYGPGRSVLEADDPF